MRDKEECIMERFFKGQVPCNLIFGFILALFVVTAHPGDVFSKSQPQSLDRSAKLTISGKTSDYVLIGERHFTVTEATVITDMKGKKIQLSDLAVPCEAQIEYRLIMDENPLALKIAVKKLLQSRSQEGRP